jgi:hypothetical protein
MQVEDTIVQGLKGPVTGDGPTDGILILCTKKCRQRCTRRRIRRINETLRSGEGKGRL